ncbi:MAG TPA: hypothetical protein VEF53_18810 [Patescibacteria group bacterium]|nr:hypothetical protein [Patescibacteria group bacterium]
MKRIFNGVAIFLTCVALCIAFTSVDFYKRQCGSLQSEYEAAKARVMSLAVHNEDLEKENVQLRNDLKETSDRLTYLQEQYEPFIKILK